MIPSFLIEKLKNQYGEELTNKILEGYNQKRKVTLRVNTIKANINEIQEILDNSNIVYKKVPWSDDALIIENVREPEITKLTIYDEGKIYLQSLSSMLPPLFLDLKKDENILDMAAAPGGKTTEMASISNDEVFITACEKNKIRADRLKYNLDKQGVKSVNIMYEDSRKLSDFFSFDKILLDAPCSGSGTENVFSEKFTKELIERSVKTQEQLINKAIKILKPGGTLIYSTCSILMQENEKIIENIIKRNLAKVTPIKLEDEIPTLPTRVEGTICVCPNEQFEGFYLAKLTK